MACLSAQIVVACARNFRQSLKLIAAHKQLVRRSKQEWWLVSTLYTWHCCQQSPPCTRQAATAAACQAMTMTVNKAQCDTHLVCGTHSTQQILPTETPPLPFSNNPGALQYWHMQYLVNVAAATHMS